MPATEPPGPPARSLCTAEPTDGKKKEGLFFLFRFVFPGLHLYASPTIFPKGRERRSEGEKGAGGRRAKLENNDREKEAIKETGKVPPSGQ